MQIQTELINQGPQPQISQNSNQPLNAPPVAQPFIPQQIPQQYFVQQFSHPYAIQTISQPNIAKPTEQQYIAPPVAQTYDQLYFFQPGIPVSINPNSLKKKLFCPRIWTWVMFILLLIDVLTHLLCRKLPIVGVIGCIVLFIVAYLVTQSSETFDAKKYSKALHLYILYFVFAYIADIIFVLIKWSFSGVRRKILTTLYVIEIGIGVITLCILCNFKKEFDNVPNPEKQQLVTPQQV